MKKSFESSQAFRLTLHPLPRHNEFEGDPACRAEGPRSEAERRRGKGWGSSATVLLRNHLVTASPTHRFDGAIVEPSGQTALAGFEGCIGRRIG
jgi:hypothetical protein